jgi:hypothetical protein
MSRRARPRKRYYRTPSPWGLLFTFILVIILILFLLRIG